MSANGVSGLIQESQKMPGAKVADMIKKYPRTATGAGLLGASAAGLGLYHAFKKNYADSQREALLADIILAEKTSQYAQGPPPRSRRPLFGRLDGIGTLAGGGAAIGTAGTLLYNNRASLPDGARGSILDSAKDLAARTQNAYRAGANPAGIRIISPNGTVQYGAKGGVLSGLKNVGSRGWQTLLRTPGIRAGGLYGAAAGVGLAGLGSLLR